MGDDNIVEKESVKLLGLRINRLLTWTDHLALLKKKLNLRLALIKRLRPMLDDKHVVQLVQSLMVGQIRYLLPIFARIRFSVHDPLHSEMQELQIILNQAMRLAARVSLRDHTPISDLCEQTGILPINQLVAETTLLEC